jgi:hypothetical protein
VSRPQSGNPHGHPKYTEKRRRSTVYQRLQSATISQVVTVASRHHQTWQTQVAGQKATLDTGRHSKEARKVLLASSVLNWTAVAGCPANISAGWSTINLRPQLMQRSVTREAETHTGNAP